MVAICTRLYNHLPGPVIIIYYMRHALPYFWEASCTQLWEKPALRAIAERGVYESYYFIGVQCNHLHHLAALSIKKRLGVVPTHFLGVGTFLELRDAC